MWNHKSTRSISILLASLLWWPCTIYNDNPIICLLQLVDKVDDKHVSYSFHIPCKRAHIPTWQHHVSYPYIEAALLQYMYWYVTWSSNEGRRIVCFSGFWQHIIHSTTNKQKGLVLLRTYTVCESRLILIQLLLQHNITAHCEWYELLKIILVQKGLWFYGNARVAHHGGPNKCWDAMELFYDW